VIFGCWTSVSRKSVLPVVEEMNGPVLPRAYGGEELSKTCSTRCCAEPAGHPPWTT
jgi:hypothetical protein